MRIISNFAEIIDEYEFFLIDLCGIIHDGVNLYDHTEKFLSLLESKNKKFLFFSNAPRTFDFSINNLKKYGIYIDSSKILTSGEVCRHELTENPNFLGKKFYYLGFENNKDLIENIKIDIVDSLDNADFFLCSAFTEYSQKINEYNYLFEEAISKNIQMICPNPDKICPHGADKVRYPSGSFALKYEEIGGEVIYFGKPHPKIYEMTINNYFKTNEINKILAIGDSLDTDIKGANNQNIDSLLALCGNYRHLTITEVTEEINKTSIRPTYIIKNF